MNNSELNDKCLQYFIMYLNFAKSLGELHNINIEKKRYELTFLLESYIRNNDKINKINKIINIWSLCIEQICKTQNYNKTFTNAAIHKINSYNSATKNNSTVATKINPNIAAQKNSSTVATKNNPIKKIVYLFLPYLGFSFEVKINNNEIKIKTGK